MVKIKKLIKSNPTSLFLVTFISIKTNIRPMKEDREDLIEIPIKDNTFGKSILMLCLSIILVISIFLLLLTGLQEGKSLTQIFNDSGSFILTLFIVSIITIPYWISMPRIVYISDKGVTKPLRFKRKKISLIYYKDVLYFQKLNPPSIMNKNVVWGILIKLKDNKQIKYYEQRTPTITKELSKFLTENNVKQNTHNT